MRILMLGLDNAGKTTIVRKFNGEEIDTIAPTLGFNIKTLEMTTEDNSTYTLNIFDVGGQKTLRSYWRNYFEETDGLIWVVDSADIMRLKQCKQELDILLKEERLAGASLLIFANKQDLKSSKTKEEIAEILGLGDPKHYKGRHFHVFGCSAKTGEGLEEGIRWCVEDIASRIFMME